MTSVSRFSLVAILVSFTACSEGGSSLSDDEIVDGWLDSVASRGPIEVRLEEAENSGPCEVPEYPNDVMRTWADGLVRLEVAETSELHPSLGAATPTWVFGPNQQVSVSTGLALYAASPWAGTAEIRCGGESVEGAIVLLQAADPIERLGVLTREGLRERMEANVEANGVSPVLDVDLSRPICPDTAEGCVEE